MAVKSTSTGFEDRDDSKLMPLLKIWLLMTAETGVEIR